MGIGDKHKKIKNCVKDPPFENYYLNKMNNTYYEYNKRCALCDYQGKESYHNC